MQKYYQQKIHIDGQTATHSTTSNWVLLLEVGDILAVGEYVVVIASIDSVTALTFVGVLPLGEQFADFKTSRRNVFNTPRKTPVVFSGSRVRRATEPPGANSSMSLGRLQDVTKGAVMVGKTYYFKAETVGGLKLIETPAGTLDGLANVMASGAQEGEAYSLLFEGGQFKISATPPSGGQWETRW